MDSPPQTKKQSQKGRKEKGQNPNRLGSSKHVRLAEIAAEKRKGAKTKWNKIEKLTITLFF